VPDRLVQLLRWYADMGVDIALDDMPHDRTVEARSPDQEVAPQGRGEGWEKNVAPLLPPPTVPAPAAARETNLLAPAHNLEQNAREAAASAHNLTELREQLLRFSGCGLKATATQLVFGAGEAGAEVMFVGEAPGADEDRQGVPFVGRAGQLLDKMLASISLDRDKVYIANVVPWRPPGNRTPTPLETAACLPFIRRQIELVAPKILVCLGAPSEQTLLGSKEGITRLRGRWFDYLAGDKRIKALAMLHPAYLLRQPAQKKLAWQDLRLLAKGLARPPGRP
jgi:uracil-DNA glycosylase